MAPQSSPSFSNGFDYDVFLSFRGLDTRYNFTGNLYKALTDRGVHTFMDDRELKGGEEITSAFGKAIKDSMIVIIVFSKNYADSSFCLDELVHILFCLDCSKPEEGRLVLPIFYGVEPTHLRHHTGSYGEAIANHEQKFQNNKDNMNMDRLQKWKFDLKRASYFSGHSFDPAGNEYEFEFIRNIVDFISNKTNRTPLHVADYRVGLESRVRQVISLLNVGSDDGDCMVGIHGIGGIGKTTLAKEVYNSIANQFDVLCFLDDVRQKTHQHGLVHLQETLLKETLKEDDAKLGSVDMGIFRIKKRLHTKKVLLILDDIDQLKQLRALAGEHDWFGLGSKVIITTRDKHLLASHGIKITYEVEGLNEAEALELLRWKTFRNSEVDSSCQDILNRAVTYASGLPLALEVVGSNLRGKPKEKWESTLARYIRNPHQDIQKILKVSFDALETDERSIFLDIACCFKGDKVKKVELILCAHHGYCIKDHIQVLVEKSLIKIDLYGYVRLHDLVEDMGKEIVRQESSKELGERSRLWFHEDIGSVLKENTGTSNIEIIYLDFYSKCVEVDWNGKAFKKMRNLKTLIVNYGWSCSFHFSEDPQHFPNSLRVLKWNHYPLQVIPSIFLNKRLENMTILMFDCCDLLTDTPNVSNLPNLEVFSFRFCNNLITIHESVGFLSKLKILNVEGCRKLKSFPPLKKLPSLQVLELSYCVSLENFPEILGEMKNITKIDIKSTSIRELPSSFQNLIGLCNLEFLRHWHSVIRVPISILLLPNLSRVIINNRQLLPIENSMVSTNIKVLHLQYCKLSDEILSTVLKLVVNVEELYLDGIDFTILPKCIEECGFLRKLSFANCYYLQKIEGIPPNLKYLDASGCKLLTSLWHSSMLLNQELHEDGGIDFRFPIGIDERIPEWFEHKSKGTSISFWFRKNVPSIALFVHSETFHEKDVFPLRAYLRIDGYKYPLHLDVNHQPIESNNTYLFDVRLQDVRLQDRGLESQLGEALLENEWIHAENDRMYSNNTYLFDLRLQDRGLESQLGEALLKNEWVHAVIEFYDDDVEDQVMRSKLFIGSGTDLLFIESGIHVFKQKTSMEDIQFTNPYEGKRNLDECLSCSLSNFLEEGWVKVNCDGVLSCESNVAACGGVLRDHLGSFLGGFAGQLGEIPILHAELKAILYGIQFAWKRGYRKVIVESKSLSAIQLLRKECPPDLSCLNLVREINVFCSSAGEVVWSHTSREKNQEAHDLSVVGLGLSWDQGLIGF